MRFLEIGVFGGGSLWTWRRFFGPEATVLGIDIDPRCAVFHGEDAQVRMGSQDDPDFLARVVDEMGGLDLVLDDGSHQSPHIRASLQALFPRLGDGGLYMIEDLHASYWASFGGGYRAPGAALEEVKAMIDDLHHWYPGEGQTADATRDSLAGLHVHDSMVVLEKGRPAAPHRPHGRPRPPRPTGQARGLSAGHPPRRAPEAPPARDEPGLAIGRRRLDPARPWRTRARAPGPG